MLGGQVIIAPTGVKWVDASEGDAKNPEGRSRLVAQEIKHAKREDLFAAMPPLEVKKTLLPRRATAEGMSLDFTRMLRGHTSTQRPREKCTSTYRRRTWIRACAER